MFNLFVSCLILIRVFLIGNTPPFIVGPAGHDDGLFVKLAWEIAAGHWLGAFNELTLIKGPFFSVFLAFNHYLGLPYLLTLHFIYISVCLYILNLLKSLNLQPVIQILFFAILLFNPVLFSIDGLRITRDSFYMCLIFGTTALSLKILTDSKENIRGNITILLFGLLIGCSIITREEGIWLLPAALVFLSALIFIHKKNHTLKLLMVNLIIIAISAMAPIITVKILNKIYYGLPIVTEFDTSFFKKAYASTTRVKSAFRRYVPVSKDSRNKLYDSVPAYTELKPFIENSGWIAPGCIYIQPCDDISSHYMWAFREAVSRSGHYGSLIQAKNFYTLLTDQVNSACKDSLLDCYTSSGSISPSFRTEFIKPILLASFNGFKQTFFFDEATYSVAMPPMGNKEEIGSFNRMINLQTSHNLSEQNIKGWIFTTDNEPLSLKVTHKILKEQPADVVWGESNDVFEHFARDGKILEQSKNARFSITTSCIEDCQLDIYKNNLLAASVDLNKWKKQPKLTDKNIFYRIDKFGNQENSTKHLRLFRTYLINILATIYRYIVPLCFIISLILLHWFLFRSNLSIVYKIFYFICLTLVVSRIAVLSYLDATMFQGINTIYLMPAMPMALITSFLPLLIYIKDHVNKQKLNNKNEFKV